MNSLINYQNAANMNMSEFQKGENYSSSTTILPVNINDTIQYNLQNQIMSSQVPEISKLIILKIDANGFNEYLKSFGLNNNILNPSYYSCPADQAYNSSNNINNIINGTSSNNSNTSNIMIFNNPYCNLNINNNNGYSHNDNMNYDNGDINTGNTYNDTINYYNNYNINNQ
jgi:hypothetical protein